MATCPKCGSKRFHYELRSGGTRSTTSYYRTGGKGWFVPSGRRHYSSSRLTISVGICPDCGYKTKDDTGGGCLGTIIIVLVIAGLLSSLGRGTKKSSTSGTTTPITTATREAAMPVPIETSNVILPDPTTYVETTSMQTVTYEVIATPTSTATREVATPTPTEDVSIWSKTVTPLDCFRYTVEDDIIRLKRYTGKSKKVRIADHYEIDGREYHIGPEIDAVFVLKSVDSVILPEGLTTMPSNTFNSCGIKYLYIPRSLRDGGGFYTYFHNIERIYYGGSQEAWNTLTRGWDIDAQAVFFNSRIEDLIGDEVDAFPTTSIIPILSPTPSSTPSPSPSPRPTPTPSPSPRPIIEPLRDLTVGDEGSLVKQLQDALVEHGYLLKEYANGFYDNMTSLAVLAFQIDHSLPPTGNADVKTQRKAFGL